MNIDNALGELEGDDIPDNFAVQNKALWLRFVSDESISERGFRFSWEAYTGSYSITLTVGDQSFF